MPGISQQAQVADELVAHIQKVVDQARPLSRTQLGRLIAILRNSSDHGGYKCRCEECREDQRRYNREWRARQTGQNVTVHGTRSSYTYGCRCEECRAANARVEREYYARRKAEKKAVENAADAELGGGT
jgi:hypothetical protein